MSTIDYAQLMRRNLSAVFSEKNADSRMRAIEEIYADNATLYEPTAVVQGRQAISDTVGKLLQSLPSDFAFTVAGPTIGHHDLCCVQWNGGTPENPTMISGTDVVQFEREKIISLYVLINPVQK